MPFSIRRLAHLNRSQSLQSRKDGSSKTHSSDVPVADGTAAAAVNTTTSSSSRSTDQQQALAAASAKSSKSMGSKASKSKSSKGGHKVAGSSDSAASSAGARGEVDQLVAIANNFNQHYKEQLEQQRHVQQQQQQQQQQQLQQHSAYIASHHGAPQSSQQHQQHGVPPSFVIRNQTTISGSAFQPVHQSAQQSGHHQSAKSYEPAALPSSRSFDSNEIRRFNAAVAASAAANQSNPPSYQESTTLRDWSRGQQSSRAVMSDGEQEPPQMGGGRGGQMATMTSTGTKRVHYAAATFTRASSLSGHMPSSGQQQQHHHHHTLAHQSASEESAVGGGGPPPPIASRPSRMVLARQTSVSTPTGSTTMASSLLKNAALQQQSSAGNGQAAAAAGLPLNLPRGGEEVLINGGGHPRGRSSSKPTSAVANHHHRHYAKQLFTSSSIDVVMTDSNAEGTQQSSAAKGSAAAHIKMDEQSSRNNRSSQKQPAGKQSDNVSSNQPDSAPSRPSKGVSQQQQQQQQQFASIGAAVPHRPSSTTPLDRNFYAMQSNQASLFDDDPGIMSEIETSATGFRRGNKVRSSLPIVRTPSKSQDRSLGLVFLQFRSETKRALLPNEITSIDTVKALFVRSFPRQLTMEYLDHPSVRIYIHDASKDMFYELEDLRDVKDRVILRIYEQGVNGPQPGGGGLPIAFQNQSVPPEPGESYGYFSEPEFDSEFQSQHVHRKRFPPPPPPMQVNQPQPHMLVGPNGPMGQSQYYGTIMLPPQYRSATLGIRPGFISSGTLPGQPPPQPPTRNKAYPGYSQTLPRGAHLMSPTSITALNSPFGIPAGNQQTPPKPTRSFVPSPGPPPPQAAGLIVIQGHHPRPPPALPPGSMAPSSASVHQHLAQQYHQSRPLPDRPYSVAGHYPSPDRMGARPIPYPAGANPADFSGYLSSPEHRPSAAMMALHAGQAQARSSFSGYPNSRPFDAEMAAGMAAAAAAAAAGVYPHPAAVYASRPPPPPGVAPIDEEARVRMQEMERQIASLTNVVSKALGSSKPGSKPPPPPKPPSLISGYRSDISSTLNSDSATQLKQIRRRARDLRNEVRALKRFALQQTNTTRESLKETCNKIKSTLSFLSSTSDIQLRMERLVVSTDRDSYNDDVIRLDKDLLDLETNVEELRSNVINRRCRVNMSNVESMALTLSRASKTVADLKTRYPVLAQHLKTIMAKELQQIEREEKFLKEEPERLEHSLKRCKKLTGTLVTLKRLASVQEQRSSNNPNTCSPSQLLQAVEKKEISMDEGFVGTAGSDGLMSRSYDADLMEPHTVIHVTPATPSSTDSSKTSATASNMLENLLDELQTFSKQSSMDSPSSSTAIPAGSHQRSSLRGALNSNAKQALLLNQSDTVVRKARSKSYSSLRANSEPPGTRARGASIPDGTIDLDSIAMLAAKCGNTAAATAALMEKRFAQSRQELLEQRHQELLRKQRQLQEQYTRLQQLSRGQIPRGFLNDLKKTGSESNLAAKAATMSIAAASAGAAGGGVGSAGAGGGNVSLGNVQMSRVGRVPVSSTVHGSLKNLANNPNSGTGSTGAKAGSSGRQNGSAGGTVASAGGGGPQSNEAAVTKKIFETEIL